MDDTYGTAAHTSIPGNMKEERLAPGSLTLQSASTGMANQRGGTMSHDPRLVVDTLTQQIRAMRNR